MTKAILKYKINFGKHKSKTIEQILEEDEKYVHKFLCGYIKEKYLPIKKDLCELLNIEYKPDEEE